MVYLFCDTVKRSEEPTGKRSSRAFAPCDACVASRCARAALTRKRPGFRLRPAVNTKAAIAGGPCVGLVEAGTTAYARN